MNSNSKNPAPNDANSAKLITALTEFIPTFFLADGVLFNNEKEDVKLNLSEVIEQCEIYFTEHPSSFIEEESKNKFLITKLFGSAKKWGLSLKADGTLRTLTYEFKQLLMDNFGDTKEQKYVLIEQLLSLKQHNLGRDAFYTIEFRRLANCI